MIVKICGVTTAEDARAAVEAGADMLGLNFYEPSPRSISIEQAQVVAEAVAGRVTLVGVFVNRPVDQMLHIKQAVGLDLLQLSGDETPEAMAELTGIAVKAIRPETRQDAIRLADAYRLYAPTDPRFPTLLLDAYHPALYGGTGEAASTEVATAVSAMTPRLMLAGGLKPGNVAERVAAVGPWGVDTASGVENGTPGIKDHARMRAFVQNARLGNGRN